uniref:Uncharacterized protein n=1 Tax=Setaria viridis TaxID=4556 RepID=A0A4U6T564_SETVI|nr:hypothetical protein SEVIR_9G389150v2 [Setaria viridis]
MPCRLVMAHRGFGGRGAGCCGRCYFSSKQATASHWKFAASVSNTKVCRSQAHGPNRSLAFRRSQGSYQRREGKGHALGLMQSLVKVGLFCTSMSLLAYTLQVTMTKRRNNCAI